MNELHFVLGVVQIVIVGGAFIIWVFESALEKSVRNAG
jgi:hypothetical protein